MGTFTINRSGLYWCNIVSQMAMSGAIWTGPFSAVVTLGSRFPYTFGIAVNENDCMHNDREL